MTKDDLEKLKQEFKGMPTGDPKAAYLKLSCSLPDGSLLEERICVDVKDKLKVIRRRPFYKGGQKTSKRFWYCGDSSGRSISLAEVVIGRPVRNVVFLNGNSRDYRKANLSASPMWASRGPLYSKIIDEVEIVKKRV